MKLQACHKCGAQFDVSSFAQGQQFTCGSCGAVLVAHQAGGPARTPGAGRAPGGGRTPGQGRTPQGRAPQGRKPQGGGGRAPAAPGRKPGGRAPKAPGGGRRTAVRGGPGAPSRGPQYQPVQRGGAQQSKAPSRGGRAPAAPRGGGRAAPGRGAPARGGPKKPNMLPIVGGIALVLIIVVVVVMGGDKGGDTDPQANNQQANNQPVKPVQPEVPADTLAAIQKDYRNDEPATEKEFRAIINRVKALADGGGETGKTFLDKVFKDGVEGGQLINNEEARTALGYKKFYYAIPEIYRGYPFIKAVETANRKTWYGPDENDEYELALIAKQRTEEHVAKLESDHSYRAGDQIRANVKNLPVLRDYNFETYWAKPFLICYASNDNLSMFDLMQKSKSERKKLEEKLAKKRKRWELVLKEKGLIMQQLYDKFLDEYQEKLGLGRLEDPWGGKPDYKPAFRSYRDGLPMIIWIFDNREAWSRYHNEVVKKPIPPTAAGYFTSETGWVFLYDEKENPAARQFEIGKNLHEGTHQMQYWFNVQLLKWQRKNIKFRQDWLGEGLAEYYGSASMDKKRNLKFHGINVSRLKEAKAMKAGLEKANRKYPIFPLNRMIQFNYYYQMQAWGAQQWNLDPGAVMGLFYQQSYAFVHFLHRFEDGKYKKKFDLFFDQFLRRGAGEFEGTRVFRQAFGFMEDEDWEDIQAEFEKYLMDLIAMDLSPYSKRPPAKDDWGDDK
ncbi:MAG: hypothetical protein QNJ98_11960 [Planctomycetota bacterium]|nr:hypothetical protein [Planctomycetota bacterium]